MHLKITTLGAMHLKGNEEDAMHWVAADAGMALQTGNKAGILREFRIRES